MGVWDRSHDPSGYVPRRNRLAIFYRAAPKSVGSEDVFFFFHLCCVYCVYVLSVFHGLNYRERKKGERIKEMAVATTSKHARPVPAQVGEWVREENGRGTVCCLLAGNLFLVC